MSFKDQKVKDRTKSMEEKVKTMKLITKKMYEITGLGNEAEKKKKEQEAAAAESAKLVQDKVKVMKMALAYKLETKAKDDAEAKKTEADKKK
jgi:hypothetical protein